MDTPLPPTNPPQETVRASDADRERVATLLRDNYTAGRLTLDELQERLDRAYSGKTIGELQVLTRDLPDRTVAAASPVTPPSRERSADWKRKRDRVVGYVVLMLFLIGIWAASGAHGSFWPIWPILVGGLAVARDVLGLSQGGHRGDSRRVDREERRAERHEARQQRHRDRTERRDRSDERH